jgi:hypothetical protein
MRENERGENPDELDDGPRGCGPVLLLIAFFWAFVFLVLAGCARSVEHATAELECQIGHVAGKFLTTTDELADGRYGGNVRMWREEEDGRRRLFLWPEDRIVACREIDPR